MGHAVADSDTGEDGSVAAAKERRSVEDIADFYTRAFMTDMAALNVLQASKYTTPASTCRGINPCATSCRSAGSPTRIHPGLYFDTTKSDGYGTLQLMDIAGQREAAQVSSQSRAAGASPTSPWRAEEPGVRRVMRWDSPWSWARPAGAWNAR